MSSNGNGNRTYVIGVGMTKFDKPGTKEGDYPEWAAEAARKALDDAGVDYDKVEQAVAGYCYGESTSGQRAIYALGLTGIPVMNVNNNCSTGSSALYMARQAVRGGLADCALALGFEKMEKGSLGAKYTDRTNPMDKHFMAMFEVREPEQSPPAPQMFGNAGREHMERYGSEPDHYAWIGWKNHHHSVNNPYAQFQDDYTMDEIKAAKMIHEPLTKLQCSPTSDGSAAAVIASERFVERNDLWDGAVELAGQAMVTDLGSTFDEKSCIKLVGYDMSAQAAKQALEEAGESIDDVDVVELHDCFSANELITYEALGLAPRGRGPQAGRGRGHHLRRRRPGGESLGRPDLEGPSARGDGPRPMLGAHLAAAGRRRRPAGGRCRSRAPAQHRARRRLRRQRLPEALLMATDPLPIAGRVIAITGGARGIGKATATALAARGARIAIGDLDADLAAETAAALGGGAIATHLDVTDRSSFEEFVDEAERELGPLDVLINNAGIMPVGPFLDERDDTAIRQMDINVHGVIHGMKIALPRMLERRRGHIVNLASVAGKGGFPGVATYCGTKHAVVGITEAVRAELDETPIEFSIVMPSFVNTELISGAETPRGVHVAEPEEVAAEIVDALERPRVDVFVPRAVGRINKAMTVLPRSAREAVGRFLKADRVLVNIDWDRRRAYEKRVAGEDVAAEKAEQGRR